MFSDLLARRPPAPPCHAQRQNHSPLGRVSDLRLSVVACRLMPFDGIRSHGWPTDGPRLLGEAETCRGETIAFA